MIPEVHLRIQTTVEALPTVVPRGDCIYAAAPELAQHLGKTPAVRYPPGLSGTQARAGLRRCRFFLVVSLSAAQLDAPALYPIDALDGWMQPRLANHFEFEGSQQIAAAVLERLPEP